MKKIILRNGGFTFVDNKDYDSLCKKTWRMNADGYAAHYYAAVLNGKRTTRTILMHRIINNTPANLQTDHINGNKLDNRRENLRNATNQENLRNLGKRSNTSSKYKGVYSYRKGWRTQIRIDGVLCDLGCFDNEEMAALAYNEAAIKHFGEFARPNTVPLTITGMVEAS